MLLNPGSGPVDGASEAEAIANIQDFVAELDLEGVSHQRAPKLDYEAKHPGNGRFAFRLRYKNRSVVIQMPGAPLHRVRYVSEDQNIFDYPRLYVGGAGWQWHYALSIARVELTGEEASSPAEGWPFIQDLISDFIIDGGTAVVTVQDGQGGVLFTDEGEFIPWRDLGYNVKLGFYRLSQFPDAENQSAYATWTVHPLEGSDRDGDLMYVALGPDGSGFLMGEKWQAAELVEALQAFLKDGVMDEPVDDEVIGTRYLSIAEACQMAHEFDPDEYPYGTAEEQNRLRNRIQRNIQRRNIWGVKKDPQGFYRIRLPAFRGWLVKMKG